MAEMKCPITGTVLHVADDQVKKFEKAGYKHVELEKPKRATRRKHEEA